MLKTGKHFLQLKCVGLPIYHRAVFQGTFSVKSFENSPIKLLFSSALLHFYKSFCFLFYERPFIFNFTSFCWLL